MGTKKIDVIQSANIAALEADVLELRTKINLVVTDLQAISAKLNILIGDLVKSNLIYVDAPRVANNPFGESGTKPQKLNDLHSVVDQKTKEIEVCFKK